MNLLLDTHTFLWTLFDKNKISIKARKAITNNQNTVFISQVSFWEISLKFSLK